MATGRHTTDEPTSAPGQDSLGQRMVALLVAGPFALLLTALLLADRAPGLVLGSLRSLWSIGSRIQARLGIDLIDRPVLPVGFDVAGHLALWLCAGLLASWVAGPMARVRTLWLGLATASVASEVGQAYLTAGRSPEVADGMANLVGLTVGLLVGATIVRLRPAAQVSS